MVAGCEALFADVGHFSMRSIQLSMCSVIYPSIVLAYFGQIAFLRKSVQHLLCLHPKASILAYVHGSRVGRDHS